MARESSLWKWLSGASKILKQQLHMNRVENSVMKGMPDVEGYLDGQGQFWIELKSSERPARAGTPVRFKVRDREAQVRWLERRWALGGGAWLLLQVGSGHRRRLYLARGADASEVYHGVNEARLRELNVLTETKPTPIDIIRRAVRRI